MIREVERRALSGWVVLPVLLFLLLAVPAVGLLAISNGVPVLGVPVLLLEPSLLVCLIGFFVVNPNEGRVLQFFGAYRGTVKAPGLRWANPFYTKRHISLRVRNFESQRLKVN